MNKENKQPGHHKILEGGQYPTVVDEEDEIDIRDIVLFFDRNKALVLAVTLAFTVLGAVYAWLKPETYTYGTAIQVGVVAQKKVMEPVTLAANIENLHIPSVLDEYYRHQDGQAKRYEIKVRSPKGADIFFIEANSIEQDAPTYSSLITKVGETVVKELNDKADKVKQALAGRISDANKRIAALVVDVALTNQRIEKFDQVIKSSPGDSSGTKTLVVTELFDQLQALQREKFNLETQVASIAAELDSIEASRMIYPVTRSIKPVGLGKSGLVFLAGIVGVFVGVIVALMAEMKRAKRA